MPTRAQVETVIGDICRCLNNFGKYLRTNTPKFTNGASSDEGLLRTNLLFDFSEHDSIDTELEAFRASHDATLRRATAFLTPALREYAKVIGVPETDPQAIIDRLYRDFIDNSRTVKERGFTFGVPFPAGGNLGNGGIERLTVDEEGFKLEGQTPDAKVAECVADEHSGGTKHEEIFEFRGQDLNRDAIVIKGSGKKKLIKGLSARDSLGYIANPSFSDFSGTQAVPTAINGWTPTVGTLADFELSSSYYRDFDGDATPLSLKMKAGASPVTLTIEQKFNFARVQVQRSRPWFYSVAVFRPDSGTTGDFQLVLGNAVSASVPLASMTAGQWSVVRLNTGLFPGGSKYNWYRNFYGLQLNRLGFTIANLPAGKHILVDDVIFAPWEEFDGGFYVVLGGAPTAGESAANPTRFLIRDRFTWSDSANDDTGSEGIIQKWLWRAFGRYLPHSSSPVWLDPT